MEEGSERVCSEAWGAGKAGRMASEEAAALAADAAVAEAAVVAAAL